MAPDAAPPSDSQDKPKHRAWFQSWDDPSERYELDEVVYNDRNGGLLQVVHDTDELKKTPAAEWRRLFQERAAKNQWPYGSGVWGYKEWVLPEVDPPSAIKSAGNKDCFSMSSLFSKG